MTPDELEVAGIGEDLVRLSVGLEDADDIIEDLDAGAEGEPAMIVAVDGLRGPRRRPVASSSTGDDPVVLLDPRRRHGLDRLAAADPLPRLPRRARRGGRPAGARAQRRRTPRLGRGDGRLGRPASSRPPASGRCTWSATRWARSSRSNWPAATPSIRPSITLCGTATGMPVHPELLDAAEHDLPAAAALMAAWGHAQAGPRRSQSDAGPVDARRRQSARRAQRPGCAGHRLPRLHGLRPAARRRRPTVTCPGHGRDRPRRQDDTAEGRPGARRGAPGFSDASSNSPTPAIR